VYHHLSLRFLHPYIFTHTLIQYEKVRINMSKQVKQFHQLVIQNPSLVDKLKRASDRESFVELTIQLGSEYGYSFTSVEVEDYINHNMLTLMMQFS
jgi:Nif11 domain